MNKCLNPHNIPFVDLEKDTNNTCCKGGPYKLKYYDLKVEIVIMMEDIYITIIHVL